MSNALAVSDFKLSPVEQAAVLMMSMDRKSAANILRHLGPREVQRLSRAMSAVRQVHRRQLREALQAFFTDVAESTGLGIDSDQDVRALLVESLGEDRAEALFDHVALQGDTSGLETLRWLDAHTIADFIGREHPQIQAIVVAYLDAEHAAEVMALLPLEQQRDIVMRVSALDSVQPLALEELNLLIARQFTGASSQSNRSVAGRKVLASVLKHVDALQVDQLLEGVRGEDQQLVSQLEELMFVFEDLKRLTRDDLKLLLKAIAPDVLAQALRGSSLELRRKMLASLSQRSLQQVRRQLEGEVAVSSQDVESARTEIVNVARKMAASGEIVIDPRSAALPR